MIITAISSPSNESDATFDRTVKTTNGRHVHEEPGVVESIDRRRLVWLPPLGTGSLEPIENPTFAEIRLQMPIEGRDIEMALFGEMSDEKDCRERAQRVWEKVIDGCATCTLSISDCSAQLPSRYRRLFDDIPIHSTYLTFTRGERGERNGRMVIWGVTAAEGNLLCEQARTEFRQRYKGQVECVPGHID